MEIEPEKFWPNIKSVIFLRLRGVKHRVGRVFGNNNILGLISDNAVVGFCRPDARSAIRPSALSTAWRKIVLAVSRQYLFYFVELLTSMNIAVTVGGVVSILWS